MVWSLGESSSMNLESHPLQKKVLFSAEKMHQISVNLDLLTISGGKKREILDNWIRLSSN